jgi:hypothetical protein
VRGSRQHILGVVILFGAMVAGCGTTATTTKPAAAAAPDQSGCSEAPSAALQPSAVMVNRSWLVRYPSLRLAVSECFRDSDTGALLLSLRVSRAGVVCDKVVQRDSTGRPASVSCFVDHLVRWEMAAGAYRLLLDLTAPDRA